MKKHIYMFNYKGQWYNFLILIRLFNFIKNDYAVSFEKIQTKFFLTESLLRKYLDLMLSINYIVEVEYEKQRFYQVSAQTF